MARIKGGGICLLVGFAVNLFRVEGIGERLVVVGARVSGVKWV
jgi:hypothetical protein